MMTHCGCCSKPGFSCGLRWESCRDFTRSQWHLPQGLFLFYRLIAVLYTWGFQIYFWVQYFEQNTYTRITNWTYLVLALYVLVASGNLVANMVLDARGSPIKESSTLTLRYMVQWVLYDVLVTWSLIVAVVYWGFLFEKNDGIVEWVTDISTHLLPAVCGLVELAITATPCQYNQIVYPITYGLMFLTFTVIYWATGNGVIYYFIDYGENPVFAIAAVLLLIAVIIGIYTVVWALTRLRQWIARKTNGCRCSGRQSETEIEGILPNPRRSDQVEGNVTHII